MGAGKGEASEINRPQSMEAAFRDAARRFVER